MKTIRENFFAKSEALFGENNESVDLPEDPEKLRIGMASLIAELQHQKEHTRKVPNSQKEKAFKALASQAMHMSEELLFNIEVSLDLDALIGKILLESDVFFIMDGSPSDAKEFFHSILSNASGIEIGSKAENNLSYIALSYHLYDLEKVTHSKKAE